MTFLLINCDLELYQRFYMKHWFPVNYAFLLPFCVTLAFVCVQLETCLEIFKLILGETICHYLGGDKGGEGSRITVAKFDKGRWGSKIGGGPVKYFLNSPQVRGDR